MAAASAGSVELGDLAGVRGGERVGAALRLVEQRLDARGASPAPSSSGSRSQATPSTSGSATCGVAIPGDYDARSPSSMSVR